MNAIATAAANSQPAHTLGTWLVMPADSVALDDLRDADKRKYCVYVDSFGDKVHYVAKGMTEVDARLIAAAPKLLAALRDVLDAYVHTLQNEDWNPDKCLEVISARAAIAAAEGV